MKKNMSRLLCVLMTAALLMSLVPTALAVEGELLLGANYEERFYSNEPRSWYYTPAQSGEYLLFTPSSGSLLGQIVGQTPTGQYTLQTGQAVQEYYLSAGTTYEVRIWLGPSQSAPYSDVFQLDKKQPLQSMTINMTQLTGQRDNYDTVRVELYPAYYPPVGLKWTTSDSSIVSIESTDDYECYFRMNKVGTATLTATLGNLRASCTVTVEKATGEWDHYEVWPVDRSTQALALSYGQGKCYSFTPAQTGTYVTHVSGSLHTMMRGTSPSHILNERNVQTMDGDYQLYDLVAGETYVVEVVPNYSESGEVQRGTFRLEKAQKAQSITLYGPNLTDGSRIEGYVGGVMELYAQSNPIYAFALDGGFRYSISDLSVATPTWSLTEASNMINLEKAGTCNITVTTGSAKVVCPVTVKPSPVLTVGKTTTLKFAANDAYGVTCLFTPAVSGNYTFHVKGSGGTCHIEDTDIGNFIYGSGAMAGWLQGGTTYKVILGVGNSDHTVTVYGAGNVPPDVEVTDPPKGDGDEDPTVPTEPVDPGDPSVPVQPSEPTEPAEPTVPVQPGDPRPDPEMEELAGVLGGSYHDGKIVVPLRDEAFAITADRLAQMAKGGTSLVVAGEEHQVELDSAALDAIARQAGADLTLQVETNREDFLNDQQKDALKGKTMVGSIGLVLSAGGVEIHDFEGGKAVVSIPFTPGDISCKYVVYYLSPEGTLEATERTRLADGVLSFTTDHFSDYVILQEVSAEEPEKPDLLVPVLIGVAVLVAAAAVVTVIVLRKKK